MRVLVTGALGLVGRWTVAELLERDHTVVAVDRERAESVPAGVDAYVADLTDPTPPRELLAETGADGVVHLAAHTPGDHPPSEVFHNNLDACWATLTAAGEAHLPAVWTSSETAYGLVHADPAGLPDHLPIREDHPLRPETPYGTSKAAGEHVAGSVARRFGVDVLSVRPTWVQEPGNYRVAGIREGVLEDGPGRWASGYGYVDVRDLARLLVDGVAAAAAGEVGGHSALNAAAADNFVGRPTAELFREGFGALPAECELAGEESAYDLTAARELLGWEPRHSWRDAADATVEAPALE